MIKINRTVWGILPLLLLAGCSLLEGEKTEGVSVPSVPLIDPAASLRSVKGCGNQARYQVANRVFTVRSSALGYVEQGSAISYPSARYGSQTAGCEILDLEAYSAAHRTLPMGSYVRVTNLQNRRTVIVRINDRGPFNQPALIQLSNAAMLALGAKSAVRMVVKVEGVSDHQTSGSIQDAFVAPDAGMTNSNKSVTPELKAQAQGKVFYVVVGSYPTQQEAVDTFIRLASAGLGKSEMATAMSKGRQVHQVRIGPLYSQDQIDNVKGALENNGLATFRVVGIKGS